MRPPVLRVGLGEIHVDSFAGGGGASTGMTMAGFAPSIAINHNAEALAMHKANHPTALHIQENVYKVDPKKVCAGRPCGVAWFSPDCTFHSKARGGKPFRDPRASRRVRGLAWVIVKWARAVRPRVILCENVEEFQAWGPLKDGKPDADRKGETFRRWVSTLRNLGYVVEFQQLRASDFGAPTSRKRLFVIARCDGQPIVWPKPSHGRGRSKPFRTAAECIDWTLPCPSIFDRRKPLAENTLKRIARGIRRFVVDAAEPFIVPMTHTQRGWRADSINEPLRTITGAHRGELAFIAPTLIQTGYGERDGQAPRSLDLHKPLGTAVSGGVKHALVAAFLARHYGGHENDGEHPTQPMHTITTQDHHALVTSHLLKFYGTSAHGAPVTDPMPTVTANNKGGGHLAEVRAFLLRYYGQSKEATLFDPMDTITTKDRFGLVTVHGVDYVIADIGMRMLTPRELFNAQGFPRSYIIDPIWNGKPLTKTAQTRMCGNSVPPDAAAALVRANVAEAA